jgi:hypothetical protein
MAKEAVINNESKYRLKNTELKTVISKLQEDMDSCI